MPSRIKAHVSHEDAKFFHMDFRLDGHEKVHGHVSFPHSYVKIKSKEDLNELLDHFGHHVVWTDLLPNKTFARRTYVERTRPAMRYYCEKYGIDVPEWLASDKKFTDLSPTKNQELFGQPEIHIVEFRKLEVPPFKTDRQQPGQQPQKPKPKAK